MSKKILLLCMMALLALSAIFTGCGGQDASKSNVLRVGVNPDFAPFEFKSADGKTFEGFDMDLIRAVGKEMGMEVQINNIAFDGLIPSLNAGNIDVIISGMTITEERAQKVTFSQPYYESGVTAVVKEGSALQTLDQLEGKVIGVQLGTTSAMYAHKIPNATVKEFNSSADVFMELKAGGVEAALNDRPVNQEYLKTDAAKEMRMLSGVANADNFGIAMNKNNPELAKKVNAALDKLRANGEYDKLYKKWFGEAAK